MAYKLKLGPNVLEQRKLPFTTFCMRDGCCRWENGADRDPEEMNLCPEQECGGSPCEGCMAYRFVYYGHMVQNFVPPIDTTKEIKRSNV